MSQEATSADRAGIIGRGLVPLPITMRVQLRLFAAHRELSGESSLDLEVPDDATPEDVFHILEARNPAVSALRPYTTFAVNREVVEASTPLRHGDEVAFLQPVSGG